MDNAILEIIIGLGKRVWRLERGGSVELPEQKTLELDITLSATAIDGLRFNETRVSAVFDLKEDGWYHSQDILFVSARKVKDDSSRDILTEYLESAAFRERIASAIDKARGVMAAKGLKEAGSE
jgi:hypothetical protein